MEYKGKHEAPDSSEQKIRKECESSDCVGCPNLFNCWAEEMKKKDEENKH